MPRRRQTRSARSRSFMVAEQIPNCSRRRQARNAEQFGRRPGKIVETPADAILTPPVKIMVVIHLCGMPITDSILNAEKLIEHFGRSPSFHDAEVVRVVLDRTG